MTLNLEYSSRYGLVQMRLAVLRPDWLIYLRPFFGDNTHTDPYQQPSFLDRQADPSIIIIIGFVRFGTYFMVLLLL